MTDKEIFERVKTHLLKQNAAARLGGRTSSCAYRGKDGFKCVRDGEWVGGGYLQGDALANALTRSGIPARASTRCMLQELQGIHDRIEPRGWAEHLDGLARNGFNSEDMFR